jgi:hypothetical protein
MFHLITLILLSVAPAGARDDTTCTDQVNVTSSWSVFHDYEYSDNVWTDHGQPIAVAVEEDTCNVAWPTGWSVFHPGN